MASKYLVVGSDPEVFLKDSSGNTVSAIGIIPGHKRDPFKTTNGYVQPDNISAEFNSKPATSKVDFIKNHKLILKDLEDIIKPLDLSVDIRPSVIAKRSLLEHPDARKAGCDPDMNAWTMIPNRKPVLVGGLRAAGGHLHISFDQADCEGEEGIANRRVFILCCDLILGVPSVILDEDKTRKKLYGNAGSCRFKFKEDYDPYNGAEYRTLSNFWLKSEELMGSVFESVERVYNNLSELTEVCNKEGNNIINIINTGNSDLAKSFIKKYQSLYEGLVYA